jgi:hypothetical protein
MSVSMACNKKEYDNEDKCVEECKATTEPIHIPWPKGGWLSCSVADNKVRQGFFAVECLYTFFTVRCRWFSRKTFFFLLLLLSPSLLAAQEATIVGTVTDPSGALVPDITITVTNVETGAIRTLLTNEVGQYVAPGLPIGKYDLKAESSAFSVQESKGVVLNVNDRVRVDFQMKISTKREIVVVDSNALAVQADSSEQSSLVSGQQISELSTNGRSIYTYMVLTTGAASLMPDFQPPTSVGASSLASFNGNRPAHNLFLLDGGENYDRGGGANSIIMPSIDAIAETQTLTSNYSADYGLSSGATISSALKSGTKTFNFSLWEFFRNNALDARNYFNAAPAPVAELRYNLYGFNVGGPVTFGRLYNPKKTKTFFFYNMEWRKLIQGQTLNQTVPLPSTYGGDFSATGLSVAQLHAPAVCQVSAAIQTQFASAGQALSGCTDGAPDPSKQVAFTNNVIPASLLDANAQALLTAGGKYGGIFPAPTNGDSFIGGSNQPTNVQEEIVRIDENVSGSRSTAIWWPNRSPKATAQPCSAPTTYLPSVPASAIQLMPPLCIPRMSLARTWSTKFPSIITEIASRFCLWAWSVRLLISHSTDSLLARTPPTASRRSFCLGARDQLTPPV